MASSYGYESTTDEHGNRLYMVGDEYVSEQEAREYAQHEADELGEYDGYPAAIAPVRPDGEPTRDR